jgi:hypothetical protein
MPEGDTSQDLLHSLSQLVRGLSALFWGLPLTLVFCVQTARGDWFRSFGILPPILAASLLVYGLSLLAHFRTGERIWHKALERARIFAVVLVGLCPFLYWWNRMPEHEFYRSMVNLHLVMSILFLYCLNPVLRRLSAMLPDQALRQETNLFTTINRYLIIGTLLLMAGFYVLGQMQPGQIPLPQVLQLMQQAGLWMVLFLILLPVAMTMAMLWKTKEVILASVFQ